MKLRTMNTKQRSAALLNREKFSFAGFFSTETLGFFSSFAQRALNWKKWAKSPFFTIQRSAALNRKKSASRFFIHKKGGPLFTAALLCAALLFPQCASVKGIFTDSDTTPTKEPDPACTEAVMASGFNGGDGTSEDTPFLICTYAQLGMMGADLSAHYALGSNIDASASCGGDCSSPSGSGWTPVGGDNCDGMDDDTCFQGTLDGRDYVISDLRVNITGDYGGLFGYTGEHAEIRSLGLSGVNVMAGNDTGGLVGDNNGSISNSYVTGAVSGSIRSGGLVGDNAGTISSSYASVNVSGGVNVAGGLVGFNDSVGTISSSYATGMVSTQNFAGGLVGDNAGTISSSYATGPAASTTTVVLSRTGGLVGVNANVGTISNSYAAGIASNARSTSSTLGGLVGTDNGGSISGINFFADNVGGPDGIGSGSCTPGTCTQAPAMTDTDAARATWLEDNLDETLDSGLNWDAQLDAEGNAVWGNLNAAGFPCLKNMPAGAEPCS